MDKYQGARADALDSAARYPGCACGARRGSAQSFGPQRQPLLWYLTTLNGCCHTHQHEGHGAFSSASYLCREQVR